MSSTLVTTNGLNSTGLLDVQPMTVELREAEAGVERELQEAKQRFSAAGEWLKKIKDRKLYRADGYGTFGEYTQQRWGFSRQHAYRLIGASEVVECLPGVTIENERTARELARLKTPEGQLDVEAARQVIEEAPGASVRELQSIIDERLLKDKKLNWVSAFTSSESVEWYTPKAYVEAAHEVMGGIDLDPASCLKANQTVRSTRYFTKEDDGLQHDWPGRVWLNPPYGGTCPNFIEKLIEQYEAGVIQEAITLLNAHSTDTNWFKPLWEYTLCFTDHRIKFVHPDEMEKTSSTHGSVFVYLGPNAGKFDDVFSQFGPVVERRRPRPERGP